MRKKSLIPLLFAVFTTAGVLGADSLDQWHWRNPLPDGNLPIAVTFGNGQFVAVGNGGAALTSPDGFHWAEHFIGPALGPSVLYTLRGIAWGHDIFVAVGGPRAILTSPDGITWTPQTCPPDVLHLNAIAYGNGTYVAGGQSHAGGLVLVSTNGVEWTEQLMPGSIEILGVAYGNGTFVAADMFDKLFCSSDPAAGWDQAQPQARNFRGVTYGADRFVVVGIDGPGVSRDGCTWTNWLPIEKRIMLSGVTYGDGTFVGVGTSGLVAISSDGSRWTQRSSGAPGDLDAVAYGNGAWVIVGDGALLATTNLLTFQNLVTDLAIGSFTSVAYGNGRFVAGGPQGKSPSGSFQGQTLASADGTHWTTAFTGTSAAVESVAYGAGLFVAADFKGNLLTSPDGTDWKLSVSGLPDFPNVTYAGGQFVLLNTSGGIATSRNGLDWINRDSGHVGALWSVAHGAGRFVAVGDGGAVLSSPDAVAWTAEDSGTSETLAGIAFGNNRFVVVGGKTIMTSPEGTVWTPATTAVNPHLTRVCFGHGTFLAGAWPGALLTSTNGQDWVPRQPGTMNGLNGVAYGQGTFVAVGDVGTILQSGQLSLAALHLGGLAVGADGRTAFEATGPPDQTWTLQASANLLDWSFLTELEGTNTAARIVDRDAVNHEQRFYRGWAW